MLCLHTRGHKTLHTYNMFKRALINTKHMQSCNFFGGGFLCVLTTCDKSYPVKTIRIFCNKYSALFRWQILNPLSQIQLSILYQIGYFTHEKAHNHSPKSVNTLGLRAGMFQSCLVTCELSTNPRNQFWIAKAADPRSVSYNTAFGQRHTR